MISGVGWRGGWGENAVGEWPPPTCLDKPPQEVWGGRGEGGGGELPLDVDASGSLLPSSTQTSQGPLGKAEWAGELQGGCDDDDEDEDDDDDDDNGLSVQQPLGRKATRAGGHRVRWSGPEKGEGREGVRTWDPLPILQTALSVGEGWRTCPGLAPCTTPAKSHPRPCSPPMSVGGQSDLRDSPGANKVEG